VFASQVLTAECGLPPVWLQVVLSILMILSTLALAIVAVYGDYLKGKWWPARLRIGLASDCGHFLPNVNRQYVHLRVQNTGPTLARNCRVMLHGFSKRGPDSLFHPVDMPFPIQLTWAPSEMPPAYRNISRSKPERCDLGYIAEPGLPDCPCGFIAQAYVMPFSYRNSLCVGKGEAGRYYVSVESDNNLICKSLAVEVSWDGVWSQNSHELRDHLRVREVPSEES